MFNWNKFIKETKLILNLVNDKNEIWEISTVKNNY